MNTKLKAFLAVMRREAGLIVRDKDILLIALIAPVFYAFFYASLYMNKGEHDVPIVVVDQDQSILSRQLVRNIDAHPFVRVAGEATDFAAARRQVESFDVQGVVLIPRNFEKGLKSGQGTDLAVCLNTTRFLVSNDLNKGITEVALTLGMSVRVKYFAAQGNPLDRAIELADPLRAEVRPMFNTTETYGDFLIPALLVIILQQALYMALGESTGAERESGTIRSFLSDSGLRPGLTVAAKGAVYGTIFGTYALFFFGVHLALFHIPVRGSIFALALSTFIFLCAVVATGLFISTLFKRKILALQVLGFTSYPIFLITGYSWPGLALPEPLRLLGGLFPMTPFLAAFTRITAMGASIGQVKWELLHLVWLILAGFLLARWRFKSIAQFQEMP